MKKQGFFLIEALLSIVIFTVLIISVFSMISFLQRRTVRSSYESEAVLVLQDGVEIARSVILKDWRGYSDGIYKPVFDADENSWVLLPGEEVGFKAKYNRKIELRRVCRAVDGEILANNSPCLGSVDNNVREILVNVSWLEKDEDKSISAKLLVLNQNEK